MANISTYIRDVRENGNDVTFRFIWKNKSAVSLLRTALLAFIRTYAQYAITLTSNRTETSDFLIVSGTLGLIVDNRNMDIPLDQTRGTVIRGYFDVTGKIVFSTLDIPQIPWFNHSQIYALAEGESITGYIDVACDDASYHPKHAAFVKVHPVENEDGSFLFRCQKVGHLNLNQIMDQVDYAYRMAVADPNKNIYTRIDIPDFPVEGDGSVV
jgi:hypothetical protein